LFHHVIVHQLPVRAVERSRSLETPPDQVAGVQNELHASALDTLRDLAGYPLAALKLKHRAVDAGKEFHVLY